MNYHFATQKALPIAQNGQIFERVNFSRLKPHTKIFEGITGLTFRLCNLINCDVPLDAVVENCNRSQIERCSNLHPEYVALGLKACAINCAHATGTDEIQVSGVTAETIYYYEDKAVL